MQTDYDAIIIGSGCAGLAAALYTSRAGFKTLVLEREVMGGEASNQQLIENYPGFANGVRGEELTGAMLEQVTNFGAEIEMGEVARLALGSKHFILECEDQTRTCKGVIVGSGCIPKKLLVPGEAEYTGKGVFYCETCEGPGFAGKPVAIAGGGDSGMTGALLLEKLGCKVTVVEFLSQPKASKIMLDRAIANPNIEIKCGTKIGKILGDGHVTAVEIEEVATGAKSFLAVEGVLVRVGLAPNTGFLKDILTLTPMGQIPVNAHMETAVPGLLAAGDVREHSAMQFATAVGDGVTAAMALGRYLQLL